MKVAEVYLNKDIKRVALIVICFKIFLLNDAN